MGGSNFKDLTGQYFGRLKVLERAEDYIDGKGKHYVQWKCECQCNDKTIIIVKRNNLTFLHFISNIIYILRGIYNGKTI